FWRRHVRNPGGATARQIPAPPSHPNLGTAWHECTNVCHVGVLCTGACEGIQPPVSLTASGPIVPDWTQSTPPQSLPALTATLLSPDPAHPPAGSKGVCGVDPLLSAQVAAFAVIVAGSVQDPVGGVQVHAPQVMGALRSAWPS